MTDQVAELMKNLSWIPVIIFMIYCIHSYAIKRLEENGPYNKDLEQDLQAAYRRITSLELAVFGKEIVKTIRLTGENEYETAPE